MNDRRELKLLAQNHTTLQDSDSTELAAVSLTNPSQAMTSSNNLLAYRPRLADYHNSNLAGVFINMEGVFPCLQSLSSYHIPSAKSFPTRRTVLEVERLGLVLSGDIGNHFHVFSTNSDNNNIILTYGVAVQDCPELNTTCFPTCHNFIIACYLPRAACS
jgi:hypothetical protein